MKTHTDVEIRQAVMEELRSDPEVEEDLVGVTVLHGVITLTGFVSADAKRLAAENAAHRVEAAVTVINKIEVRLSGD